MAHRMRSRTADSAENKKTKGTPRRLTEKIAIMRRREHEQSAAFQKAMKSIFEMQQAQQARANIHSGGGSMPSLAAIDTNPPPSIDMQSVFNDLNEVKLRSFPTSATTSRERPHSGGPTGRRSQFDKRTQSCDTDPYPTAIGMGHVEQHYLNQPTDWIEGDLSRHKSDSDLQQSLLTQQPGLQPMQQFPPLVHPQIPSSQAPPLNQKHFHMVPNDIGMWGKQKRPASISTAASLLSPDTAPHTHQNTLAAPGTGTASSSLPDLTNIEFHSGLEVPLERDDPIPEQPVHQNMFPYHSQPQPGTFPTSSPSNLLNSFQANQQNHPLPNTYITNHAYVYQPLVQNAPNFPRPHAPPNNPLLAHGPFNQSSFSYPLSTNIPALNLNPSANWRPPPAPFASAIRKSPTAPNFQIFSPSASPSIPTSSTQSRVAAYQQFHPLLPSLLNPAMQNRVNQHQGMGLGGSVGPNFQPTLQQPSSNIPSPMNIVIQPPVSTEVPSSPILTSSTPTQPVPPFSPSHSLSAQSPLTPHTAAPVQSPSSTTMSVTDIDSVPLPIPLDGENPPRGPFGISSLPATPTITISPGFPALPSYIAAKQQQALQEKFASFGMHKTEHLIRSHSEENLQQKVQKDKGDLMHNPFMGNLANASSVPCVYVDSPSTENIAEQCDSPTTGDSPSTSASYASSPPSVRPFWIDQHQANEFVFHGHEWPIIEGATLDKNKPGSPSPLSHHKSLTDLNAPVESTELPPKTNRSLQLSLPSIVMSDLATDDQVEKPGSPVFNDYGTDDATMDTLLKQELLQNFDVDLLAADALMSSSPDSLLHKHLHF